MSNFFYPLLENPYRKKDIRSAIASSGADDYEILDIIYDTAYIHIQFLLVPN